MGMNTTLTIKVNKKLKDDLKKVSDNMGVSVTTLMNAQIMQLVRDGSITLSLQPRPEKIAEWEKVCSGMEKHPEKYGAYDDVEDAISALGLEK